MENSKSVLGLLGLLICAVSVQGQNEQPSPSTASIVGFSIVLSFLIIALCIVMLLCVCIGKCRLPCKPVPRVHQVEVGAVQDSRRLSSRRQLIPQPSPKTNRPSSLDNTTITIIQPPPERNQRYSSLPPSNSMPFPMAPILSPHVSRGKERQNPWQLADAVNSLTVSTASTKVVHLSQLNADSFKTFASSNNGTQQHKQKSASLNNRSQSYRSSHQRTGSDVRPNGQTMHKAVRPEDIPEGMIPYQPQRSPYTPHSTSRPAYSFPPRNAPGQSASNAPIPYLSNVPVDRSSPIPDTGDDISSATNDAGHNGFPRSNRQDEGTESSKSVAPTKTPPPSFSTVV